MKRNKVRVFLADDHQILREGLRLILGTVAEYEVVGESGDGKEASEMIEALKPDVAILDISMPTMSGIEIARYIKKYVPDTKILVLSRHDNEMYIHQLLAQGVNGYILKDDAGDDLIRAVQEIIKGNIYLSPRVTTSIVSDFICARSENSLSNPESPFEILSSREREILKLIGEGKTSKEIGSTLRISPKTVKSHRANIMKKLDMHKVNDLVAYAIKNGFVEV